MRKFITTLLLLLCLTSTSYAGVLIGGSGWNKGIPVFVADFTGGTVDSRLTFTRSSNAWYFDQSGTLVQVSSNVPRPYYNPTTHVLEGILMEGSRTNVFLHSQSPATQSITVTAQAYTLSFYGTGSIALSGTYTGTLTGTGVNDLVQLTFTPTAGSLTLTVSGTITNVQLEAGSFATSRIVTTTSSYNRRTDQISSASIPWFTNATGTVVTDGTQFGMSGYPAYVSFNDGTTTNEIYTFFGNSATPATPGGSVNTSFLTSGTSTLGTYQKIGLAWSGNTFSVSNGGAAVGTLTKTVPTGLNTLNIGYRSTSLSIYGVIKSMKFWNTRLTDTQLRQVTQ